MTSATPASSIRYSRLVHACKKFLATDATQASSSDISKFVRCVHHALNAIQADNALVNTTFHDDLHLIEADLKALHGPTDDESAFPTQNVLRQRRQRAVALRSSTDTDPIGAILSHVEGKVVSTWEDKKLSLMDDDFMTFSTADFTVESASSKSPSVRAIRDQLGLVPNNRSGSLSAAKSVEAKEALENELQALSSRLKHATHGLNQNLKEDATLLDQVAADAEANQAKLDTENRKLAVHRQSRIGFFTTMYLLVGLGVVFIAMYLFMKVWSTRHYPIL
ncbi:hypothetical protein, variant [Aphanomyces astaci]|uniref:Vesicle transport protein USE1 n=1 Tax=Aphanomyces astaci TaxID=112090 RepID=W4GNT4_APHAT|nr:hypothetical protein, variant [Aphanomyces astaci]ETV81380.1 hypothetical protein, variant [Aphanomyces astaci]|eukprot:XP_009829238.1 hypothetical protein, variant [Aphanomyces astaci]